MRDLISKEQSHLLYKDELGSTFLLLKYAEVYRYSKNIIRLYIWGRKIYEQIKEKGIIVNEVNLEEAFNIIDIDEKHLVYLIKLGAPKRRPHIGGHWILDKEKKLAHKILAPRETSYTLYQKEANWKQKMTNYLSEQELTLLQRKGKFSMKNHDGLVRDHKYSRYSGFKNNVPPILLRHPVNCTLLSNKANTSKSRKNTISLPQLFQEIRNFKSEWYEQKRCLNSIKKYAREYPECLISK